MYDLISMRLQQMQLKVFICHATEVRFKLISCGVPEKQMQMAWSWMQLYGNHHCLNLIQIASGIDQRQK